MLFPAPTLVPPHESVNHCAAAPVPANPPLKVKVVESPKQMDVIPVILVGATDGSLTVNAVGLLVAVPDPVVTVTKPVVPKSPTVIQRPLRPPVSVQKPNATPVMSQPRPVATSTSATTSPYDVSKKLDYLMAYT